MFVVAPDAPALPDGVDHVADPHRGQGAAVRAGLDAAIAAGAPGPYLVVNADLPCATPRDLLALAGAVPEDGLALVAAADGTTNALGLRRREPVRAALRPRQRRAVRGARRRRGSSTRRISIDDVDTLDDLAPARLTGRPARRARVLAAADRRRGRGVNVAVLSGGVGGARFLRGLVGVVDPGNVSIVGNVADDLEVLGLHVSPDLDSILYALAGRRRRGARLGPRRRVWRALETVAELGGEAWFRLGDRDLGLHLVRTQLLRDGAPLSEATARIAHALGLAAGAAAGDATTRFARSSRRRPGRFPFQTWFVARGHRDEVDAVHYAGAPEAVAGARACSRRSQPPI